jgi:hypothetical protein
MTSGSAAPALDPVAVRAAARSKEAGQVIEVTNEAAIAGCRDLGDEHADTSLPWARGRAAIRDSLKAMGRARGASHVQYSDHITIDSGAQREHGHFYDCTSPAATPRTPRPPLLVAFSGQLEILPAGTLHGPSLESDTATAFGVSGNLEYILSPLVALGVNPGVVLGLKDGDAMASATQLDLRARIRFGKLVGDGFGAHVYTTGGGSWIFMPNGAPTSKGASFGVGAGVSHRVERSTFVTLEVGFQYGFQNASVKDVDVEASSRLFHVGFGIGSYL